MGRQIPDSNLLPLFGCITGIELSSEEFSVAPGLIFRRGIFEIFSAPMLAFKEAPAGSHTPAPWVKVDGGFAFKARVEMELSDLRSFDGFSPSQAAWLVAALLRIRVHAPVRIAAIANMPLNNLPDEPNACAIAFEAAPYQLGLFKAAQAPLSEDDLIWLVDTLPIATSLFQRERFMRAFSIFDEALWSSRVETATVLVWSAIEILFDLSGAKHKTRAICSAVSDWVGHDAADRNRAYNVIRDLYEKRGRIVHSGRGIEDRDFGQSFALAKAAFVNILGRNELPELAGN